MYPKLKKIKKVPVNCSSTPTIHDHLKTSNPLMTDISVRRRKHQLLQTFAKYVSNTARDRCIGPNIILQVKNEPDMILCKIIAKLR